MFRKVFGGSFALAAVMCLLSATVYASIGWTGDVKIVEVAVQENLANVKFEPAMAVNATACNEKDRVYIDMSNGQNKNVYAAVLSAAASGKTVTFKFNDASCPWGAAMAYRVVVKS